MAPNARPSAITKNKKTSSSGSLIAARNRTIDNAPTKPKDKAREYFTTDSKHYFNDLVFDVDGIIEGYNFHSILFDDIKHNNRKIYTGYFADGSVQTFHDFNWSAKSKISGNEYNYPCHCRWVWEDEKIVETICIVDPAAIFAEIALYQENN